MTAANVTNLGVGGHAEGIGARALEFAILTAVRSGEVRGAMWSDIDMEHA